MYFALKAKFPYLAVKLIGAVRAVIDSVAAQCHRKAVPVVAIEIFHAGVEISLHPHGGADRALVVPTHRPFARPYTQTR
jgi:hypothetical protein